MSVRVAAEARQEQMKAVVRSAASGWLLLVAGARPADPDALLDPERTVARLSVSINAINVQAGGVATIGPLEARAERPGVVKWFRLTTPVWLPILDGDIGVSAGDLRLTRVDLLAGDLVQVESITLTAPVAA